MKTLIYKNSRPYLKYLSKKLNNLVEFEQERSVFDNFAIHRPSRVFLDYTQLSRPLFKCLEKYDCKALVLVDEPKVTVIPERITQIHYSDYIGVDDELFYKTEPDPRYYSEFVYNGSHPIPFGFAEKVKIFGTGNENNPRYCGLLNDNFKRLIYASADSIYVDTVDEFYIALTCNKNPDCVGAGTIFSPNVQFKTYREIAENICEKLAS